MESAPSPSGRPPGTRHRGPIPYAACVSFGENAGVGPVPQTAPYTHSGCAPLRRVIGFAPGLGRWLTSGIQEMTLHRAQLLTLGVAALMHRITLPSPGRDCLLFVRARWCFSRAPLHRESRGPVSHTVASSVLCIATRSTVPRDLKQQNESPDLNLFWLESADLNLF